MKHLFLIAAFLTSIAYADTAPRTGDVVKIAKGTNLRSAPDKQSVIFRRSMGTELYILVSSEPENDFLKVRDKYHNEYYVYKSLVSQALNYKI